MSIAERLRAAGLPPLTRQVWLEIDTDALRGNVAVIRSLVGPDVAVWPVVKADGYGHGIEVAARSFRQAGADGLCVAALEEAHAIRAARIGGPVLVLYPVPAAQVHAAARAGFEISVSTVHDAEALAEAWLAGPGGTASLRVHLEVETGLTRMGVAPDDVPVALARLALPGIRVAAVWSHLATPEQGRITSAQEARLVTALVAARRADPRITTSHLAATGGLLTGRGDAGMLVRPGLIAYGVTPAGFAVPAGLRPAMRLKAQAMRVVEVPVGTAVGYGGRWVAARPSRIATLPVGYGDGVPRSMSGAPMLVRGRRVPIVGVVAMDALMVDVTDVPDVTLDDEFVLLGPQGGDAISVLDLAQSRTTIPWEVLTSMARRPTRVYDAAVGLEGVRTLAGETLAPGSSLS